MLGSESTDESQRRRYICVFKSKGLRRWSLPLGELGIWLVDAKVTCEENPDWLNPGGYCCGNDGKDDFDRNLAL